MTARRQALAALALAAAVAALLAWVQASGGLPGEVALGRWALHERWPLPVQAVLAFLDAVATPLGALVTVPTLAAIAFTRGGTRAALTVAAAGAVVVPVAVLKALIGPTAPWIAVAHVHAGNFPSGHTAYTTATFGAAAALCTGRWSRALLWSFIVTMGPARVLAGVHALSDVLGGYATGAAWLAAVGAARGPAERLAHRLAPLMAALADLPVLGGVARRRDPEVLEVDA